VLSRVLDRKAFSEGIAKNAADTPDRRRPALLGRLGTPSGSWPCANLTAKPPEYDLRNRSVTTKAPQPDDLIARDRLIHAKDRRLVSYNREDRSRRDITKITGLK
jgi:hypothetical protein